jgi:hypothetical protein
MTYDRHCCGDAAYVQLDVMWTACIVECCKSNHNFSLFCSLWWRTFFGNILYCFHIKQHMYDVLYCVNLLWRVYCWCCANDCFEILLLLHRKPCFNTIYWYYLLILCRVWWFQVFIGCNLLWQRYTCFLSQCAFCVVCGYKLGDIVATF